MHVVEGHIDYTWQGLGRLSPNTCVLFTGNSTIKRDGSLVMGRGAAKQVRDAYPGIDYVLGQKIEAVMARECGPPQYGLVWIRANSVINSAAASMGNVTRFMDPGAESFTCSTLIRTLGCFQVKHDFKDNADLELIEYSAFLLGEQARRHPELGFRMNYPGIGWGHLTEDQVAPILSRHLPDNVILHK